MIKSKNEFINLVQWKMGEHHYTKRDLALDMMVSEYFVYALLDDEISMNYDTAKRLSSSLGESADFWMELYKKSHKGVLHHV